MKKVITTVGTSLFTNFMNKKVKIKYGKDYASVSIESAYMALDNTSSSAVEIWNKAYKHYIKTIKENVEDFWFADEYNNNIAASAEIASLLKIAEQTSEPLDVHLITTDTLLSVLAAELIVTWFDINQGLVPNIKHVFFQRVQSDFDKQDDSNFVVKDLQVKSQSKYEDGFMNLLDLLERITKNSICILNITGGYKGIVPLVTVFGQVKNIPVKYLFQEKELRDNTEILTVGDLPIDFDYSFAEMYGDFISVEGLKKIDQHEEIRDLLLEKNLINPQTKGYKQTPLGKLFFQLTQSESTRKKSFIGYYYEFIFLEHFSKQANATVSRSVTYWWDKLNNKSYHEPQYEQNKDKEVPVEIDLVIKSSNEDTRWYEVKPYSKTGLKKALQQLKTRIEFLNAIGMEFPKRFTLLLYKLPHLEIASKRQALQNIFTLGSTHFEEFTIEYVEMPLTGKGLFDPKALSHKGIEEIFQVDTSIFN